jgi:hypothetical protein
MDVFEVCLEITQLIYPYGNNTLDAEHRMLRSLDELEKGFGNVSDKSRKECGDILEDIRKLIFLSGAFLNSVYTFQKNDKDTPEKFFGSLHHSCLLELVRISGGILFLSANGLYRNAFDNIRHAMESVVQAIYIDNRHPMASLETKIEILKEIEDKKECHAVRLIDELKIAHKDRLKAEYKELSRMIHPSHKEILTLIRDLKTKEQGIPVTVDREEISNIYESMKRMYDIFFFLILTHSSELTEFMKREPDFCEGVKFYRLSLAAGALDIEL